MYLQVLCFTSFQSMRSTSSLSLGLWEVDRVEVEIGLQCVGEVRQGWRGKTFRPKGPESFGNGL